jgi:general secretion pathway protein F
MGLYRYEALDPAGKTVRGTTEAGTPAEARAHLRDRGFHAKTVDAAVVVHARKSGAAPDTGTWRNLSGHRLNLLSNFSRHMAMLLKSGLPLAQSLSVMSEQIEDKPFRLALDDIAVRVREGAALDTALAAHPHYFPELYVCVSKAGAASGSLPHILGELAAYYTRQKRLRDRVISALTYPALMTAVGLSVLIFLMAYVVPKVTAVLIEQKRALPWPTEFLLAVSGFIQAWWLALLIAGALAFVAFRATMRTQTGLRSFDRLMLALPVFGNIFKKQAVARWADTMSNLIFSGIPVAQALAVVRGALGNRILAEDVARLETAVIQGRDLSEAIKQSVALPKSIGFVVGVGEESGELPRVLREVALSYNEEVELITGRIADLVNPILIVVLGLAVGFIVAAILLPITDFSNVQ